MAYLQGEIPDACGPHEPSEALGEGHEGDGLIVQLRELQHVDCRKNRLLELLSTCRHCLEAFL